MAKICYVDNIRPDFLRELNIGDFSPRTEAINAAYHWGREIHSGQTRLSGEPYFETHCAWVANFIDKLVGNEAWTIAALLHDSVEDRGGSLDEIRAHFPGTLGEEVAYIVDGVTKLSAPREGRTRQLETLRKIAMFRDPGVFLVKLADKSHNVLTLNHMDPEKARQKGLEAIRAYGKLAGILNCYRWRRWLEDMAFPYADPETYAYVKTRVDRDPRLQITFINGYLEQLGQVMSSAGIEGRVEITANGYWQAWQKLRRMARVRKTSLDSLSALNDIVSFRMIVQDDDPSACYLLLGAVNRWLGPCLDQDRFDDYIAMPQNGYRALQVTGWLPNFGAIEIAITTQHMEGENLWGVIYAIKNRLDISQYRPVEILTPSGGTRFVPEGSTVLDAVASIQQEFLLDKISAVKVNGWPAQLADQVRPGDVVEVITSGERLKPVEGWLNICSPATARLVRMVLAVEGLKKAAEEGRRRLKELLDKRGILSMEDVAALERDKFDNLLEQTGCSSLEDLYAAVGGGAIRLAELDKIMDDLCLSRENLDWSSIDLYGTADSNKPGVLAQMARLISDSGGNIIRTVIETMSDRSFNLRIVVKSLELEKQEFLKQALGNCDVEFTMIVIV